MKAKHTKTLILSNCRMDSNSADVSPVVDLQKMQQVLAFVPCCTCLTGAFLYAFLLCRLRLVFWKQRLLEFLLHFV